MDNPPGGPERQRPRTATVAGLLTTLCGVILFGPSCFGALRTIWWIFEIRLEFINVLVGLVYFGWCLIGLYMSWTMLRDGPDLLRGQLVFEDELMPSFAYLMCWTGIGSSTRCSPPIASQPSGGRPWRVS